MYDQSGNPTWVQDSNEKEQPDLAALNIRVPRIDMVRIPISLDPPVAEVVEFQKANTYWSMLQPGSDCVILGYPSGYNSMGMTTPLPIFLKRAIAANITENIGHALLDGGGAPGMSGSPVITRRDGGWRVMGMYTGVIFPDHQYGPVDFKNDKGAALGMMIPLHFGRTFLNVPDLVSE